jgi:hypothetical protein
MAVRTATEDEDLLQLPFKLLTRSTEGSDASLYALNEGKREKNWVCCVLLSSFALQALPSTPLLLLLPLLILALNQAILPSLALKSKQRLTIPPS